MGFIALKTVHPTWLTLQLPGEVAKLLEIDPEEERSKSSNRGLVFFSRGPEIARVVALRTAKDVMPLEIVRDRYLATATVTGKQLFNLPQAVIQHLGIQVLLRGENEARSTDDELLWFVPEAEYYEYRAVERFGRPWTGPGTGGLSRVYLSKAVLPLPAEFPRLAQWEQKIETEEWSANVGASPRAARARPAG